MRVQIVHDEDDLLRFRSVVNQPLYFFSPIYCGSVFSDTLVMPTGKRFNKSEDTACSISHIFRIYLFVITGLHILGFTRLTQELVWFLIHADDRVVWIVRTFIDIKNVFHACYEFGIFLVGDAPVLAFVRPKFVFFNTFPIVDLLTCIFHTLGKKPLIDEWHTPAKAVFSFYDKSLQP